MKKYVLSKSSVFKLNNWDYLRLHSLININELVTGYKKE